MLYYFGREVLLPSIEGNRTSLRKPRNLLWEVQILSAESQGTSPAVFSFFASEVEVVGGLTAGSQMLKRKEKCLSLRILIDEGAFRRPAVHKDLS